MSEFLSLLPFNATPLEQAAEEALARVDDVPVPFAGNGHPETCPPELMPWLAWALSVDVFDSRWPVARQRQALAASIDLHRLKGTRGAVIGALEALAFEVELSEWFEHGGAPYTFRLDVFAQEIFDPAGGLDLGLTQMIRRAIETMKPAREHYDLRVGETFRAPGAIKTGLRAQRRQYATVTPAAPIRDLKPWTYSRSGLRKRARCVIEHLTSAPPRVLKPLFLGLGGLRARSVHRADLTPIPRGM